jgi:hypothetical protein
MFFSWVAVESAALADDWLDGAGPLLATIG